MSKFTDKDAHDKFHSSDEEPAHGVSVERIVSQFKVGKYYKHGGGGVMHIVGAVKTTLYGWTLVAEEHGSPNLRPVGQDRDNAQNWEETTEEHWLAGFSG